MCRLGSFDLFQAEGLRASSGISGYSENFWEISRNGCAAQPSEKPQQICGNAGGLLAISKKDHTVLHCGLTDCERPQMPDDSRLPSTHVTWRLPADLVERFEKLAAAMDRPRSWVMLRALRQYLEAEGAELEEDIESLAEADRGEVEPFETIYAEAEKIIEEARKKKRRQK